MIEWINQNSNAAALFVAAISALIAALSAIAAFCANGQNRKQYMHEEQANNADCGIICSIKIPASAKKQLLKQLDLCGVNEKLIYPGIEGVGRFIRKRYSYNG